MNGERKYPTFNSRRLMSKRAKAVDGRFRTVSGVGKRPEKTVSSGFVRFGRRQKFPEQRRRFGWLGVAPLSTNWALVPAPAAAKQSFGLAVEGRAVERREEYCRGARAGHDDDYHQGVVVAHG